MKAPDHWPDAPKATPHIKLYVRAQALIEEIEANQPDLFNRVEVGFLHALVNGRTVWGSPLQQDWLKELEEKLSTTKAG